MKKKYILNYDENQHGAVVALDGAETMVQVDEGELTAVNFHRVLNGKAISIRFGGRLHLIHLSGNGGNGSVQATIDGRPVNLTVMDELRAQALESNWETINCFPWTMGSRARPEMQGQRKSDHRFSDMFSG